MATMFLSTSLFNLFLSLVAAQQSSSYGTAEVHPVLSTQKCTNAGGCISQSTKVVIDANWRWLHSTQAPYQNCFTDPSWDSSLCPDPVTCSANCALDGARYQSDYGVSTSGSTLTLQMYPNGYNVGSRVYLLADDTHYAKIPLANQEISFDVDASRMPCGTNGALYFVDMDADGGAGRYPGNKAGAAYGVGYCDAQSPKDLKFINGEANLLNWNPNTRTGRYGSSCAEIDVWEANSAATAYTLHPCSQVSQSRCDSTTSQCSNICDQPGCDFNTYRNGNKPFYGPGGTVDPTSGTIRVITQFITDTGTPSGTIKEVKRFYMKRGSNGQLISNGASSIAGVPGNSLNDNYCSAEKRAFGESNPFSQFGGFGKVTEAAKQGMVLTMSAFVDYAVGMRWLDSTYPDGANPNQPGVLRGPCATNSGDPNLIRNNFPNAQVQFKNIKFGEIGSTYGAPYL